MNKKIIFFLSLFIISFLAFSNNVKKETSFNKVSFLLQKDSVLVSKEFLIIKELYSEKKYQEAIEKSLIFIEKKDNNQNTRYNYLFEINYILGDIFRKNNNNKKSIFYYSKSVDILNKEFGKNLDKSFSNAMNIKRIDLYLKIGNRYLYDQQIDSAKYFYYKVISSGSFDDKSLSYKASASANISAIYMRDSLYDQAQIYANKSIEIHRKRNNKISEAVALGSLASIYLSQNNYNQAKRTYKDALNLIKNEKSDRALRVREKLYFNLAYNLYVLKDYEAYTYQELSYNIKDTLRDQEIRHMIEELGFKYDFDSKKQLLLKQEENKRLRDLQAFLVIGIIGLLIIISLAYRNKLNKLKQKNQSLNFEQQELLQNQEIEKIKSESQIRILNATIDGKESERKEIAQTLHDSVSALLSSAKMHLQATKKQFNGSTPVEIEKTQEILSEASIKIRDLSHNLASSVLLNLGLYFAVKDLADKFSNSILTIDVQIGEIRRYDQNFEIKMYHIIQELINNILKHSQAGFALIELKEENNKLLLRISDDGIGFDKTKINLKDGLGINQISARIQLMKGDFHIESSINNGTQISVKVPVVEKEEANLV